MSGFMKTVSRLNQVFFFVLFTSDICLFLFFAFAITGACNSYLA